MTNTNTDQQVNYAKSVASQYIGKTFVNSAITTLSSNTTTIGAILQTGQRLRDVALHEYPLLPAAIHVYQQIASSREWHVSGSPRGVARAVEWFNNAEVYDPHTGMVYYGFQGYQKRRVLDYLTVGRTTFLVENIGSAQHGPLTYIDPVYLTFKRSRTIRGVNGPVPRVTPEEVIWQYTSQQLKYKSKEIILDHPLPISFNKFIAPIIYALPSAILAYLINQHDRAAADGRKIRDIILVNTVLESAIEEAISISVALHAGESASDVGVPVIPVNNPTGANIQDQIATLGLSQLPENFDRDRFDFHYANVIAATLGLSLRHFWQLESGSNRALETVQEARQQQKGPAAFIRTEQRLVNRSGLLEQFKTNGVRCRFGFIEEVDVATKKANAVILKQTAEALEKIQSVFKASIDLESYLAWMQSLGTLPNELKLVDARNTDVEVENPDSNGMAGDEAREFDTPEVNAALNSDKDSGKQTKYSIPYAGGKTMIPDYDEIVMNGQGQIVDRRLKVFRISEVLAKDVHVPPAPELSEEESYEQAILKAEQENRELIQDGYIEYSDIIQAWSETQRMYESDFVNQTVQKLLSKASLEPEEQNVIDMLVKVVTSDD